MELYASIDVGTTNWKAAAFDINGNMVAIEKTPAITNLENGIHYFDAKIVRTKIIELLIALKYHTSDDTIKSIAVTGMAESFVLLDQDDKPINKILAWFDNRPAPYVEKIKEKFTDNDIFSKCGLDIHPMFSLTKLLFIKSTDPTILRKTKLMLQLPEYITYVLSGVPCTDYSLASRTMLLNINTNTWDKDLLNFAELNESQLPKIVNAGTIIGKIKPQLANQIGVPFSTIIAVGGHDHPCAAIATGVAKGNSLLDSSGTAESFLYVSNKNAPLPTSWNGLRVCRFLTNDKFVLWGGIPAGGASIQWGMNQFKNSIDVENLFTAPTYSYEDFCNKYLVNYKPNSKGLLFLPYLRGAGAPYWNGRVKGGYLNLSTDHTTQDLLTAIFEGLAMHTRLIIEKMNESINSTISNINTVGGGAKLLFAQKIKANVCKMNINLFSNNEATLAGCAFLGAIATKNVKDINHATDILSKISSNVSCVSNNDYDTSYTIYKKIYNSIQDALEMLIY